MIGTLSKHEAEAEGFDDALMLDWRGQVAEATGANIFFVIDGELHTPTPDCFLDGITRRTVMSLATRPPDEGGRARDHAASELGRAQRGVPGRHRRRGDAGAPDRRAQLHAGPHHRDAADATTTRSCGFRPKR